MVYALGAGIAQLVQRPTETTGNSVFGEVWPYDSVWKWRWW